MFGREKIQALESKLGELKGKLQDALKEKDSLKQQLESAKNQIADLKAQWEGTDLEQTRKELKASIAEYEGLKELYNNKIQEFNATRQDKEQEYARQAALDRHNLDNEIQDRRLANQEYVASTVKAFGESYNYYLNQIKMLMDALGDVASQTGEALFSEPNGDLKAKIGQQMAAKLKAETDPLRDDSGNLILIGGAEKVEEEQPAEEAAECVCDAAEEVAESAYDAVEEVSESACDAVEEVSESVCDAVEETAETAFDAVEAVAESAREATEEAAAEETKPESEE